MKKTITTLALGFIVAGLASCASAPPHVELPPPAGGTILIQK